MTGLRGFYSGGIIDSTVFQAHQRWWASRSGWATRRWGGEERAGINLAMGLRREGLFEGLRRAGFPLPNLAEMPLASHFWFREAGSGRKFT